MNNKADLQLEKENNKENNFSHYARLLGECSYIISCSENQELIYHSQNTVQWAGILSNQDDKISVSSIKPKNRNLEIAAFTHEIERAVSGSLHPHNFQSYALYKQASTIRSSEIMEKIMNKLQIPSVISSEILKIIRLAAVDDKSFTEAILLKEADILSFFSVSLPNFFIHKISDKLLQEICIYELKRLGSKAQKFLAKINVSDIRVKYYINSIFKENA